MDNQIGVDANTGGGEPPVIPNNMVLAIISTLCCCLPLGIVAIIKAASVNTLIAEGKYEEAKEASKGARLWAIIAMALGLLGTVLYVGFSVLLGVMNHR